MVLAENASAEVADRFLAAVESTAIFSPETTI